jgi:hypothetical protein
MKVDVSRVTLGRTIILAGCLLSETAFAYRADANTNVGPFIIDRQTTNTVQAVSSQSAGLQNGLATASAAPGFVLRAAARGQDQPLGHANGASATVFSGYSVSGNSTGQLIPMNFNFNVGGSLSASSSPSGGISDAEVFFRVIAFDDRGESGEANYALVNSTFGYTTTRGYGGFFSSLEGISTPRLSVNLLEGLLRVPLTPDQFAAVMADPTVANFLGSQFFLAGLASGNQAVFAAVTDRIRAILGNGNLFEVDMLFGVNGRWNAPVSISTSGFVRVDLSTTVWPYPGPSTGEGSFGSTLQLTHVTFADGFDASGLGDITINFDDGSSFLVTAVPELSTFAYLAAGLALALAASFRRRLQHGCRDRTAKLAAA